MAQEKRNSFQEITKYLNLSENGSKNSQKSGWGDLSTLEIAEKIYNLQDMISDQLYALRSLHVSIAQLKDNNTRVQCEQIIKKHETELSIQEKKLSYFEHQMAIDHTQVGNSQEVILWIEKCFHQNEKEFLNDMKNTFNESSYQKMKGLGESMDSIKKSSSIGSLKEAVQDFCTVESKTENKKSRGFFEKLLGKSNKGSETLATEDAQKHAKKTLKESGI